MNIYKLPVDAYNRTHEQTISEDTIKDKLVGQKRKEYEAKIVNRGKCMLCGKELTEGEGIFFCKECEEKAKKQIAESEVK